MYRLVKDVLQLIGASAKDLADKAGLPEAKVFDFENNVPSVTADERRRIAEAWLALVREKAREPDSPYPDARCE
jgi:hypothetical protein